MASAVDVLEQIKNLLQQQKDPAKPDVPPVSPWTETEKTTPQATAVPRPDINAPAGMSRDKWRNRDEFQWSADIKPPPIQRPAPVDTSMMVPDRISTWSQSTPAPPIRNPDKSDSQGVTLPAEAKPTISRSKETPSFSGNYQTTAMGRQNQELIQVMKEVVQAMKELKEELSARNETAQPAIPGHQHEPKAGNWAQKR